MALLVVVALLTTACDLPAGPTEAPETPPPTSTKTILPVEPQFRDSFWRQIAFDGRTGSKRTGPLTTTSPNLYIRMGDPTGRRVVAYQLRDHMRRAFPRLVEQITGKAWRGQIRDGIDDWSGKGWITVRFVTQEEEPERADRACGRARVGTDPGAIWIIRRARGNKNCVDESHFKHLFAHEVGHALGLFHVNDRSAVMHPSDSYATTFTAREQYHGRLLYRVGRGKRYCGWPFGASC